MILLLSKYYQHKSQKDSITDAVTKRTFTAKGNILDRLPLDWIRKIVLINERNNYISLFEN